MKRTRADDYVSGLSFGGLAPISMPAKRPKDEASESKDHPEPSFDPCATDSKQRILKSSADRIKMVSGVTAKD